MSGMKKDEPGTPWTPPRTPPKTSPSQAQVQTEDVSQDTPRKRERNSVENTTRVSSSQNDEDPKVTFRDLEEDTNRTPLVTRVVIKGIVEDTTRTPLTTRVGLRNLEEDTPNIPLDPTDEEQRDPGISTSPATSTPGASPTGLSNGELRDSELQGSEESVIESSLIKEDTRKEIETDDVVVVRMVRTSLSENSEVEEDSHNVEDTSWETTLGDTTSQEGGAKSCVAQRTRSHTGEMRKMNLTELMDIFPTSMENSFEIIETNAVDSLNLPRPEKEVPEWENRKEWCGKLQSLDISMDKVSRIGGSQKQEEIIEMYKRKIEEVARKNEEIKQAHEGVAGSLEEESKRVKSVTFLVEEPKYNTALEEVIKALETLMDMNLSNAPVKNIENIIKIILSICIDYSTQMQSTQETMITMTRFIRELVIHRYRLEILEDKINKIEGEKQATMKEVENLKKYNTALKEVADSMTNAEKNKDRDIVAEIAGYRAEIEELVSNAKEREEKYTGAYSRKEHYKRRTEDLERKIASMEGEVKKEREREASEKQTLNTEMQGLIDHNEAVRERAQKLEEKIGKLERTHETDIADIMENQAVQSELENGRRLKAEERVADLEMEIKKVRSDYNRILRTRDSELATAQRKREDDESALAERERINKNLWDMIDTQREEMELKDLEIGAYKYYSLLWGEKDPKVIFDPKNPQKRYKPKPKVKTTEKDDSGINTTTDVSNAEFQSSTAGVYGDTEGCMDTTQGQDDTTTTIETHIPNQRGAKRKKMEMVGAGRVDEKERLEESSEESCSTAVSGDEKEPNKKKRLNKNRADRASRKGITQQEHDRKIRELKKEHHKQMKEQEKKNDEGLEALKRELEQKRNQEIESIRNSYNTEGMEVQAQKPEEAGVANLREEEASESREIVEGKPGSVEIQDPQISSQEKGPTSQTTQQTPSQNSELGTQTPFPQNSEKQVQATPIHGDPSTQNREEGKLYDVHATQTSTSQNSENQAHASPMCGEPSTQNREEGKPNIALSTSVYGDPPTQNREGGKLHIVTVTEDNINRTSNFHKGLLLNRDGTLSMTPQYWTWIRNTHIQLQRLCENLPEFPAEINSLDHPVVTMLYLEWTHDGEWVLVPLDKLDKGPIYKDSLIARIERYIDLDGKIKRAVSYGDEESKLNVWFDIEEMKQAFPNWYIPTPNPYYNGRRFTPGLRRQAKGAGIQEPNPNPKINSQPRDQPAKGIQGKKANQQNSKNKWHKGNQHRSNAQSYQEWDRQQKTGNNVPKNNQQWEQESWDEYQSRDQSWDQPWDQQGRQNPQQQDSRPRERYQKDSRDRGRDRGTQDQEYDQREPQEGYQTKEYAERRERYQGNRPRDEPESRYREVSRDRQGDRRQRERSMSPRRQRKRSPSPMNSGRGRGGGQRDRSYDAWNDDGNGRGRGGGYGRRGNDASYGGT